MITTAAPRIRLSGSERLPLPGAVATGPVQGDERIDVTVQLRPKAPLVLPAARMAQPPSTRPPMTRDAYAAAHGASAADIAAVAAFAVAHGLAVLATHSGRRSMTLSGTATAMMAAFDVQLCDYAHDGGTYRGRVGPLSLPAALDGVVVGVFGLDDRPQARPQFQRFRGSPTVGVGSAASRGAATAAAADAPPASPAPPAAVQRAAQVSTAYTPPELAHLYQFPTGADGSGQCIAIVELGGGYRPADLKAYFTGLGLATPKVSAVRVDGGRNAPTTADGADAEVMLDIEVAGAVAPKASIVVYFAPNTDQGFLDAITTAVHDTVHKPSVVSISWGSAEVNWTAQSLTQFDAAFQAAAVLGVTVCCAAGDNGSADGQTDGAAHADFPASSPHALACGGTKLLASGSGSGAAATIASETVWNEGPNSATGGGVSRVFALPDYQQRVKVPAEAKTGHIGRGLPDVAGDADPATGYRVRVDGQDAVIGGTSAVAPLWAGLIALLNQRLGHPVGWLQPLLYGTLGAGAVCNDITSGDNGAYAAGAGWDACTGWGSPNGTRLLEALGGPNGAGAQAAAADA